MGEEWDNTDLPIPADLESPKAPPILSEEEYRAADVADIAQWDPDGKPLSADELAQSQQNIVELRQKVAQDIVKAEQSQSNEGEQ